MKNKPPTHTYGMKTIVRTRVTPKVKQVSTPQQVTPTTITKVRPQHPIKSPGVPRKIGQTTIYRSKPAQAKPVIAKQQVVSTPVQTVVAPVPRSEPETVAPLTVPENLEDLTTLSELNESETPLIITGEDGTIYQVAGQNEQGQTILISQVSVDSQSFFSINIENESPRKVSLI